MRQPQPVSDARLALPSGRAARDRPGDARAPRRMARMPLITLQNVDYSVGGPLLLENVELSIEPGERIALIGRNGAGKSTLLRLLSDTIRPDDGEIRREGGVRIARLEQEVPHGAAGDVFDVVAAGMGELGAWLAEYHHLSHAEEFDAEAMGNVQAKIEAANGWGADQRVVETLDRLSLDGDASFAGLSGGMKRRVLLARALVSAPDLLLLDEPTNHLDIEAIDWLEEFLKSSWKGALVFVTHDRRFLRALATRIVEIDRGQVTSWPGDWANYERRREERLHAEAQENARFDKMLAQEEVWIRQGIKARRTRDEGRVRRLKAMRNERAQRRDLTGNVRMDLAQAESSGKKVIEAKDVTFGYGGKLLLDNVSTTIFRGDRIGLIGPNGSGKTTLLKALLGELAADRGRNPHGQQPAGRLLRPVPRDAARGLERAGERVRGPRVRRGRRPPEARDRLPAGLPVHARTRARADHPPVRRRAQPPAAGQAVRAAVQPAGDGRTDQRPRCRDAGVAGRTARRIPRHAAAGQPRPRLPRQRGDLDAGDGRRRPRRRVRRRLQRLGAAAAGGERRGAIPGQVEPDAGRADAWPRRPSPSASSASRTRASSSSCRRGSRRWKRGSRR